VGEWEHGSWKSFRIMPLFLRFLVVSVDLILSLTPDLTLNWVIAMKQKRMILTLAALLLTAHVFTTSVVSGTNRTGRSPGFSGYVSAPSLGNYEGFLQDEAATPAEPGFGGYLGDNGSPSPWPAMPQMNGWGAHKSCSSDGCYGFGYEAGHTRLWGSVDYMMMWSKGRYLPPLVTTDPKQVGRDFPGTILFGGKDIGEDFRSAGRFSLGVWLDRCEQVGVGGRLLLSQQDELSFQRASNAAGLPVLARPFYDTGLPAPLPQNQLNAVVISSPISNPTSVGRISDQAKNDLMNLDAYLRVLLYEYQDRRLDLLIGYQFSEIRDSLQLSSFSTAGPAPRPFTLLDTFDVTNSFHGAALGLQGEYRYGGLTFSMLSKLGFGNMHRQVRIDGASTASPPPGTPFVGGMYAQPTNMGVYKDDVFAFVPEVELKMAYEVARGLEVGLGYSFVYWTDVALAGDQMDTITFNGQVWPRVDRNQFFGGTGNSPVFDGINDAGFWAQGLTFGVTFKR
jgi:hypothetical protein